MFGYAAEKTLLNSSHQEFLNDFHSVFHSFHFISHLKSPTLTSESIRLKNPVCFGCVKVSECVEICFVEIYG